MHRVEQIAKIIQVSLEDVFRNSKVLSLSNTIVSIMNVDVSPNLGNANIYISFMSNQDPNILIKEVDSNKVQIRHLLAAKVRNKMRRVPSIYFYLDTSIQDAFALEEIIKKL